MSEWIPCKDSLPPEGKTVLLYLTFPNDTAFNLKADPLTRESSVVKGGRVFGGQFVDYHDQYGKFGALRYVTHWMPIPVAPDYIVASDKKVEDIPTTNSSEPTIWS